MANTKAKWEDCDWLLSHSRQLFIYHATQRQTSLRDFYYAIGIFSGSYMIALRAAIESSGDLIANLALLIIGCVVGGVTWTFQLRDRRNEKLVHVDEEAQKEIENYAKKNTGLEYFDITKRWEIKPEDIDYKVNYPAQYKMWVPKMFCAFYVYSGLLIIGGIAILLNF